jgi:hypothetical protein
MGTKLQTPSNEHYGRVVKGPAGPFLFLSSFYNKICFPKNTPFLSFYNTFFCLDS